MDVTEREGEFNETEREGVGVREREKGKSVEKGRGKYREGGSLLTKDGVKMEGEKYGKGDPRCYSTLPLSLSFSLVSFWAFRWEYAYRNALEDFEISQVASPGPCGNFLRRFPLAPKRDTRCLMPRLTNGNILKASVQFRSEKEKRWIDF